MESGWRKEVAVPWASDWMNLDGHMGMGRLAHGWEAPCGALAWASERVERRLAGGPKRAGGREWADGMMPLTG